MPSQRKLASFSSLALAAGFTVAPVEHTLFSLEGGQAATTRHRTAADHGAPADRFDGQGGGGAAGQPGGKRGNLP